MIISEVLTKARQCLNQSKINSANLDAEIILMKTLNRSKEYLYSYPQKALTKKQEKQFWQHIKLRSKHLPTAYITNEKEFYNLTFFVNQSVLIPRPETELLVETVIKIAKNKYSKKISIADIGTGSGAIAISLKKNLPDSIVIATDKSQKALAVAKKNAKRHKTKINFALGNLICPLGNKKINILVANLPYLPEPKNQKKSLQTKGLNHEPQEALYSGLDGLDTYKSIIQLLHQSKNQPDYIIFEHGINQSIKIKRYILKLFPKAKITSHKDLAGINRYLIWEQK